jgi:hypothetical protein
VSLRTDDLVETDLFTPRNGRSGVVVAGPSSSLTVPGIIVSEITQALAKLTQVTRIEVDLMSNLTAGLTRAPSLAAAHDAPDGGRIVRHRAPSNPRLRAQAFRDLMAPGVATVIAYAWPGIDNGWIRQFVHAGRTAGALTVVACASLPQPGHARAVTIAGTLVYADVVLVGEDSQGKELISAFGRTGPHVESHAALSLDGRSGRSTKKQITAFLPKDDRPSLTTLLAAFDAIPEKWVEDYNLQVVMRFSDLTVPRLVKESYHKRHVQLIGDDLSSLDLQDLVTASSALGIAAPLVDSRAFSVAIECGVGTVVFDNAQRPEVGRGYVGGLRANRNRSASVHVALNHALRLSELQFPNPDKWDDLAQRVIGTQLQQSLGVQLSGGPW